MLRSLLIAAWVFSAGIELPEVAEPTGQDREQAVAAVLPYLLSHRSRLAALQAQMSGSGLSEGAEAATANQTGPDAAASAPEPSTGLAPELWPVAACAIDTAIVKASAGCAADASSPF